MTTPANSQTNGDGRTYVWPPTGEVFTSVTTILNVLNKPFLTKWSAKMAAEYAVSDWGELTQLLIDGRRDEVVNLIKEASSRSAEAASEMGTMVHSEVEDSIRAVRKEGVQLILPHMKFFEAWKQVFNPEFLLCESTVYNRAEGYAGTMDLLCQIEDRNIIVDVKTGKQVYPEVALQLAAYSRGEWYRSESNQAENQLPEIHGAGVLHLRPNGYKFVPVCIDDEVWQAFRYIKEAYRWQRYTSKRVLNSETVITTTEW